MVGSQTHGHSCGTGLSVLALSSRFDGLISTSQRPVLNTLSVLALSSRFDGHPAAAAEAGPQLLSVLALSSRFDGRNDILGIFGLSEDFQYSLCRVVLMVPKRTTYYDEQCFLSVLALSSRFDGR